MLIGVIKCRAILRNRKLARRGAQNWPKQPETKVIADQG